MFDVAIIGAGVVGSLVARELSKYYLNVCLIDKEIEPGCGTSKANSAIVHAGYDALPGTKKVLFNVQGNEIMEGLCKELDVSYKKTGSLVLAFNEEELKSLEMLLGRGMQNNVKGLSIIRPDKIHNIEPFINKGVIAALYASETGIISPYELAIAAAENAIDNGVCEKFGYRVISINKNNKVFEIKSKDDSILAKYIINCAGVYGDEFCEIPEFKIKPRKGEYLLLDKNYGHTVSHVIFQTPTKAGKGILVSPTVHGNIILGPTSVKVLDKEDDQTTLEGLNNIKKHVNHVLPGLDLSGVITSFAGLRATSNTDDFLVDSSKKYKGLINAIGIESPGLTASPAIALYLVELLRNEGLILKEKTNGFVKRKRVIRFSEMTISEKNKVIEKNPAFGRIVCRCEGISEGEIVDSIKRSAGAKTVDGVKRRIRAGMGRCQGGFCIPKVLEILSRELGVPQTKLTKKGGDSWILAYDKKENIL